MTLRDSEQRREVAASPWRRCNYCSFPKTALGAAAMIMRPFKLSESVSGFKLAAALSGTECHGEHVRPAPGRGSY